MRTVFLGPPADWGPYDSAGGVSDTGEGVSGSWKMAVSLAESLSPWEGRRTLRRVTLARDVPVGPDGRKSMSLHKEARRSVEEAKRSQARAA